MIFRRVRGLLAAALLLAGSTGLATAGGVSPLGVGSPAFDYAFGSVVGGMLCRTASGWAVVSPGSANQVLTIPSGGGCPNWATMSLTGGGSVSTTGSPASGQIAQFSGANTITGIATVPLSAGGTGSSTAAGALTNLGAASIAAYDGRAILALSGTSATSGATLVLSPLAGNGIIVNGALVTIPDAGISLSSTGLGTATLYYVYLTSAAALEASTTAPVVQAGTGLKIKGGTSGATDPTRRLVGMALTGSNGYFFDSAAYRYVRSYFNDPGVQGYAALASNISQTSSANGLIGSALALMWGGEIASAQAASVMSSSGANGGANIKVGVNGTVISGSFGGQSYGAGGQFSAVAPATFKAPSDGLYTFQSYVASDGSNTATFYAGATTTVVTNGNGVK